jgi:hypothetical protein
MCGAGGDEHIPNVVVYVMHCYEDSGFVREQSSVTFFGYPGPSIKGQRWQYKRVGHTSSDAQVVKGLEQEEKKE